MATVPDTEKSLTPHNHPILNGDLSGSENEDLVLPSEEFVPPDGGAMAWSQVLAANLINWMAWGLPTSFGVYQLHYKDTLKLPESQVAWIGSVQVFLTFGMCTVSGRLADAGYTKQTIAVGSFLSAFGTLMTSLATRYWQIFLAQGVCTGLGLGVMFMPAIQVVNSYFRERRSLALSVAATGTGLGSLVFPSTVQYLIPRVGFPWAVRCSAFIIIVISTIAILILKPRLKPRKAGSLVEWEAFREAPYALYTGGALLIYWALYFGYFYINAYARNIVGFDTISSVQLLLITNGLGIPSRPVVGFLADRYTGPINMFTVNTFILALMIYSWMAVKTKTGMYIFAVFFGLANGAAQGVFVGALASLNNDPRRAGTRFGMVCTLIAFVTLAGPPTAGAIIDATGGQFTWACVWGGSTVSLGAFIVAIAKLSKTRGKIWMKV